MQTAASKKDVPAQCPSARILFTRIDSIIEMIPADFPPKGQIERVLRGRQDSIRFTAPGAMNGRWQEVGELLNDYLPNPDKNEWVQNIARLFSSNEGLD